MHTGESVCYSPSKSTGFGHSLRRRGVRRAWDDVQRFYAACTDVAEPTQIELEVARPTEWDDDATMWPIIDRALEHFGPPAEECLHGSVMWPSGELTKGGMYRWNRQAAHLAEDLEYLIAGEPWPKCVIGPITLKYSQTFRWKVSDALPSLGRAHPEAPASGGSFRLWFSRRSFVQPGPSFPFLYDDPTFLDFLRELQPYLPFRMHSNHFRRVIPGKKSDTFSVRKMPWPVVLT